MGICQNMAIISEKYFLYIKKRCYYLQKRAYSHIENISNEVLLEQVKQKILNEIDGSNSIMTYSHLSTVFSMAKQTALQEVSFGFLCFCMNANIFNFLTVRLPKNR